MDPGFFSSKHFVVSGLVAVAIIAGAAGAYYATPIGGSHGWSGGCDAPSLAGAPLAVEATTEIEDDGERRVVTYRLPAGSYTAGSLDACSPFGEIVVDPALGDEIEVRFTIEAPIAAAVEETDVVAQLRDDGGALVVGAWIERIGETSGIYGNDRSAHVRLQIRLPDTGAWDIDAHSSAGDVHVSDVMVGTLDLESSFGNVVAIGIDLAGDATLMTSAGDATLSLASVQSGRVLADSSFGNVEIELPSRADVGYDVVGETSFGEVTIRIGPTDEYDSEGSAGERETARTAGYDSKPTKVQVTGTSSAGDVRIVTSTDTATQ